MALGPWPYKRSIATRLTHKKTKLTFRDSNLAVVTMSVVLGRQMGVNPCEVVSCTRPEGCLYGWPRSEAQRKLWEEAAGLTHHPSRKELIICRYIFMW